MSTPLKERPDAPLGTLIFRAGLLPAETIENALEEGVKTGRRLGEILVERGLIKEEDLTRLLAGQKGLPFVSVREKTVDPEAARLLAEDQARLFNALPIGFEDGVPVVALADPTNEILNRNIREALGRDARFVVAPRSELNEVITEVFNGAVEATPSLTVDTSVPPLDPELASVEDSVVAVEPEPVAAEPAAAEPELVAPAPEPTIQFDASDYEPDPAPEPEPQVVAEPEPQVVAEPEPQVVAEPEPQVVAEPEPQVVAEPEPQVVAEPEPQIAREAEPEPVVPAFETPAPAAAPVAQAPADPEPVSVPLATEPVAPQTLAQSNGEVPKDFEDDSPPPAPAGGTAFRVSIRLTSGERITVTECAELGEAKGYAKALTKQLGATDSEDWPFVNGRFLKPDTIVSVDVEQL